MKNQYEAIKEISKDIKLLYVEDNEDTRQTTAELLHTMFPTMFVAINGKDAFDIYEKEGADLIITDIEMPKLDGFELIRKVRNQDKDVSILITSAYDDSHYLSDAIGLGVDGYIIKPFNFECFLDLLLKTSKNINMKVENRLYKESLEKQVAVEILKREDKERLLLQQSKMAAMGDMIDAIAHQWKQPLSSISMYMDMLYEDAKREGHVKTVEVKDCQDGIDAQVEHLLNTLTEFRTFFKTDKETTLFSMSTLIDSVLLLMRDELLQNQIKTEVIISGDDTMPGSENEVKHLLINLINNAKDAFNEKAISRRKLIIRVSKDKRLLLEVEDNAGGIEQTIEKDIFLSRATTKNAKEGSGIGLYMSLQIVQKHQGQLWAENIDNGARFSATFPLN